MTIIDNTNNIKYQVVFSHVFRRIKPTFTYLLFLENKMSFWYYSFNYLNYVWRVSPHLKYIVNCGNILKLSKTILGSIETLVAGFGRAWSSVVALLAQLGPTIRLNSRIDRWLEHTFIPLPVSY